MTGSSTVDIGGVTYEVDFKPNMASLVFERPETVLETSFASDSTSSTLDEHGVVGDSKKNTKKKNRFRLSLPSKLKKKLKSRTNKKKKGKSKMSALLSKASAFEPSNSLIQNWKSGGNGCQDLNESSGSLFAGRLEDDTKDVIKLPTIHESPKLLPKKSTQNQVVEERKFSRSSKKQLKQRLKRFLKKFKKTQSSESSVADTASTTSSPRINMQLHVDHSPSSFDAMRDDTEVAVASVDETFFSLPSEPSLLSSNSSNDVELPASLTLVQPSSVARQASVANNNLVWKGMVVSKDVVDDYPSDEEDSSVDSIVSPVPSTPPTKGSPPRKKILNYKKVKQDKKKKITNKTKTVEKAPVVLKQTTVAAFPPRWNVWALVLVTAALCALSVWQKCFSLPQGVSKSPVATLVNTDANISYFGQNGEYYHKMEDTMEDSEWPYDESLLSETPVTASSFFDENGVLDSSYPIVYC